MSNTHKAIVDGHNIEYHSLESFEQALMTPANYIKIQRCIDDSLLLYSLNVNDLVWGRENSLAEIYLASSSLGSIVIDDKLFAVHLRHNVKFNLLYINAPIAFLSIRNNDLEKVVGYSFVEQINVMYD